MLWYFAVVIFLLLIVTYVVLKYHVFNYWKRKNVPFAKPNLIFGNIWDVIFLRKTWSTFISDMHNTYTNQRYVGIYNMFQPAIIIRDLEIIKDILIKDFDSFYNNWYEVDPHVDPILYQHPFVLRNKEWKYTRTLLTPQYTTFKIKSVLTPIQGVCNKMVQYLKEETKIKKSTCFELIDLCARFSGETIMNCAYSLDGKSFSTEKPDTFIIFGIPITQSNKLISFKRTLGLLFKFFRTLFKVTFYGDPIHQRFSDIITKAVDDRVQNNITRNDYLNYILELKRTSKIDNSQVPAYAFTIFFDGFETSFATLSYVLFELCTNRNVQEKARLEVKTILSKYHGIMSYDAYTELNYIERVVLEAVRKNSIIRVMSKVCTKNYVIKDKETGKDFTIEKGTPVFWSLTAIHNNSEYYPEPDKFNPDRFNEENKQSRPKLSYLGFGEGPRICLGRKFAMAQMVLAVAAIVAEFELRLNTKTTFPILRDTFHVSDVPVSLLYVDFVPLNEGM